MDEKATAMKLSQEGFDTMRDIHAARLAIFNSEPKIHFVEPSRPGKLTCGKPRR
ncbi:MAG: hypothetical protein HKP56_03455 [Anderseniella sp.]|nr:hypothetical protein [Anderseniella sp.]